MSYNSSFSSRHFLFLQGPHGPFFCYLGQYLQEHYAAQITRINFNGGDFIDWLFFRKIPQVLSYNKTLKEWPAFIKKFMKHQKVTEVVLYGDCRPLHKAAIQAARELGIRIHVFEEGYIRPFWVTYEKNGVNANSDLMYKLPKTLATHKHEQKPITNEFNNKSQRKKQLYYCLRYYLFLYLGKFYYKNYSSHRKLSPGQEAYLWIKRIAQKIGRKILKDFHLSLPAHFKNHFIFALQLDGDYQIREHSSYSSMLEALVVVMQSFANQAPKASQLLIKNHPLDNGYFNYRHVVYELSCAHGIQERVFFIDDENLSPLLMGAKGFVTVNSTSGIQALGYGIPTKILGKAFYDIPGMTSQNSLDIFWRDPTSVDKKLFQRFRHFLLYTNQINGSFYISKSYPIMVHQLEQILFLE